MNMSLTGKWRKTREAIRSFSVANNKKTVSLNFVNTQPLMLFPVFIMYLDQQPLFPYFIPGCATSRFPPPDRSKLNYRGSSPVALAETEPTPTLKPRVNVSLKNDPTRLYLFILVRTTARYLGDPGQQAPDRPSGCVRPVAPRHRSGLASGFCFGWDPYGL